MREVTLRIATEEDVEPLGMIHRAAMRGHVEKTWGWDEAWQTAFFREHFPFGQRQVIERGGETAGLLDVVRHEDHIELANIMIAPRYHRMGIGSTLIRQLQEEARASRMPLRLQVLKVNVEAKKLYDRLEFERCGETETHFLMRWLPSGSGTTSAADGATLAQGSARTRGPS